MRRWIGLITTLIIAGGSATLSAQPANPAAADTPPLMAGRVAAVEGEVSIWRAEEAGGGQWDRAQINDIVTAGTGLATDNGRVEVRFGPHVVRLGEASTGGFSQLDYEARAFNLERGVVSVRLAPAQQAETVTLTVADVRVDLAAPGRYRVDAIGNAPLAISVFDGRATVQYGGNAVNVGVGQALNMTQSSTNFAVARMSALDDWALSRDARYEQAQAPSYVSPIHDRLRGTRHLWRLGHGTSLRQRLGAARGAGRLGTVPLRPLALGGAVGLELGRLRTVGLCAVSLRPLGDDRRTLVLVARRLRRAPGVGTCAGRLRRRRRHERERRFRRPGRWLVSAGAVAPVPSLLSREQHLRHRHQPDDHPAPAAGVPPDINQRPGSTWVAGPRFREPIAKVHIPARTEAVAELRPAPPPPRPIMRTPAVAAETGAAPGGRVAPARPAPAVAQNSKFSAAPPQALPGCRSADGVTARADPIASSRARNPRRRRCLNAKRRAPSRMCRRRMRICRRISSHRSRSPQSRRAHRLRHRRRSCSRFPAARLAW